MRFCNFFFWELTIFDWQIVAEKFTKIIDPKNILIFDNYEGELDKIELILFSINQEIIEINQPIEEKKQQQQQQEVKENKLTKKSKKKTNISEDPDDLIFHSSDESDIESDTDSLQSFDLEEDEIEDSEIKPPK